MARLEELTRGASVKGILPGTSVTVRRNEVLTALNKPDAFILHIVEIDGDTARPPTYVTQPFHAEPDFSMTSTTYNIAKLVDRRVTA